MVSIEDIVRGEFRKFLNEKLGKTEDMRLGEELQGRKGKIVEREEDRIARGKIRRSRYHRIPIELKEEIYKYLIDNPRKTQAQVARKFGISDSEVSYIWTRKRKGIEFSKSRNNRARDLQKIQDDIQQTNKTNRRSLRMREFWNSPKGIDARKRQSAILREKRRVYGDKWLKKYRGEGE